MTPNPPPIVGQARDLFDAYVSETGIPLSHAYHRQVCCTQLVTRGVTPDDVRAVLRAIARALRAGEGGFTPASLQWRNTLGNPDNFEERVLAERQRRQRAKGASIRASKEVREVRTMPDGTTIARLVDVPKEEPRPVAPLGSLVEAVRREMEGGSR